MSETVGFQGWLLERRPRIPPPLLDRLLEDSGGTPPTPEGLAGLGVEALGRALECPGRVRESAFLLLAGDALLTYACEALARTPHPAVGLEGLMETVGGQLG